MNSKADSAPLSSSSPTLWIDLRSGSAVMRHGDRVYRGRIPISQADLHKVSSWCLVARLDQVAGPEAKMLSEELQELQGSGEPSSVPGAWTCPTCGFRGFWSGGPHCMEEVQP